jgi:predicted nucleic acid-binding protein
MPSMRSILKRWSRWLDLMNQSYEIVLTDWIIAETGNGLARSRAKGRFVQVAYQMLDAPSVEVVLVDDTLLRRALANYSKYSDKTWGLVDCASFTVMEERGIIEAFTSDRDFEQAGFSCMLC